MTPYDPTMDEEQFGPAAWWMLGNELNPPGLGNQNPPNFKQRLKAALPRMLESGIAAAATPNIANGGATDIFRAMQAGGQAVEKKDLAAYNIRRQNANDAAQQELRKAEAEWNREHGEVARRNADERATNDAIKHQLEQEKLDTSKLRSMAYIKAQEQKVASSKSASELQQNKLVLDALKSGFQMTFGEPPPGDDPSGSPGLGGHPSAQLGAPQGPVQPPPPVQGVGTPMQFGAAQPGAAQPATGPNQQQDFDTKLSPEEEQQFQEWKQVNAPNDSGADYDLRGAFKAGVSPAENGHWPDTFKKPNHPTFSVESQYAQFAPDKAGHWDGDTFIPPAPVAPPVTTAPKLPNPFRAVPGARFTPIPQDQLTPGQQAKIAEQNTLAQVHTANATATNARAANPATSDQEKFIKAYLAEHTLEDNATNRAKAKQEYAAAGARPKAASSGAGVAGGLLTPAAVDQEARKYITTGRMTALGQGSVGIKAQIINRSAEIAPGQNIGLNESDYKSFSSAKTKLVSQMAQVRAFEKTATANLDIANGLSKKVTRSGSPLLNQWVLAAKGKVAGDEDTRAFEAAVRTAANEYAKVVTSNGASGQVTDSARHEYDVILNAADNPQTFARVVALAKQEMGNRNTSFDQELAEIDKVLSKIGGTATSNPAQQPQPATGKITVIDPNGKAHLFDTQAAADAFKALLQGSPTQK